MAKGGMGNIMKQAQMMQANLQKAQAELASIDVEGAAGNGMIKITISCKHEIKKIDIGIYSDKNKYKSGCKLKSLKI